MSAEVVKVFDGIAWQEVRDSFVFDGAEWERAGDLYVGGNSWTDVPLTGPSPWSPLSISSLWQWMDATDAGTITKNGSNQVTRWSDKTGNVGDFVQLNISNSPVYSTSAINGNPAVVFSQTTGFAQTLWGLNILNGASSFSIIMVMIPSRGATQISDENYIVFRDFTGFPGDSHTEFQLANYGNAGVLNGTIIPYLGAPEDHPTTNLSDPSLLVSAIPVIMRLDIDPVDGFYGLYKDPDGTANVWEGFMTTTADLFYPATPYCSDIGAGQAFITNTGATFTLGEFLSFSTLLDSDDLANIYSYLKTKWGIS